MIKKTLPDISARFPEVADRPQHGVRQQKTDSRDGHLRHVLVCSVDSQILLCDDGGISRGRTFEMLQYEAMERKLGQYDIHPNSHPN